MLCRITESFLASATRALPLPDRLAIACAQSFKLEALFNRVRTTPAASYIKVRASISPHFDILPLRSTSTGMILSRRETEVRDTRMSNRIRGISVCRQFLHLGRANGYEKHSL